MHITRTLKFLSTHLKRANAHPIYGVSVCLTFVLLGCNGQICRFHPSVTCVFALRKGNVVELVGFEPTSKQGNHTLSTRLFQPSVFVHWQDLDHQPMPYPLKFHSASGATPNYFRFLCTAISAGFGTTASERCLVPSPSDGIKPKTYYTSVRQRERNFFRQLNCR